MMKDNMKNNIFVASYSDLKKMENDNLDEAGGPVRLAYRKRLLD